MKKKQLNGITDVTTEELEAASQIYDKFIKGKPKMVKAVKDLYKIVR